MACKMCEARGHNYPGDPPRCAFVGEFGGNWNCATLNALRALFDNAPVDPGLTIRYCDNDDRYAVIDISEVECDRGGNFGVCLWLCWYKQRGHTAAGFILDPSNIPRSPTEHECLCILKHYGATVPE